MNCMDSHPFLLAFLKGIFPMLCTFLAYSLLLAHGVPKLNKHLERDIDISTLTCTLESVKERKTRICSRQLNYRCITILVSRMSYNGSAIHAELFRSTNFQCAVYECENISIFRYKLKRKVPLKTINF